MANNLQTNFKIILNSNDVATWTGATKFNASYNLDLKQILQNDSYFDKQYQLTYNFQSTRDATINASSVYLLNLQFNNGASSGGIFYCNGNLGFPTGILQTNFDGTANFLSSGEQDNASTYVSCLRNLNKVNIQITDHTYTTFPTGTVNYVCVLHFTEVNGVDSSPTAFKTMTSPSLPKKL